MSENKKEIEIRSDEVQEIMSYVPNWMIRWGMMLIFILICLLIFITWFIKYPDVVSGTVTLTTVEPPIKLVAKNSGEIKQINLPDYSKVKKGDILITLISNLSLEEKVFLDSFCNELRSGLSNNSILFYKIPSMHHNFGIIQSDYTNLTKGLLDYQYLLTEDNTVYKIDNLKKQIQNQVKLQAVSNKQFNTSKKQLDRAKEKFESDKLLYENKVLSKMQFYEEEKKYHQAESNVESLEKTIVQHDITLTDYEKQLNDLEFNFKLKQKELLQQIQVSLSIIENEIANWELNYQIKAPIDGQLTYLENISEQQYIEGGKELFAIIPDNQEYLAYVKIPQMGYGKIKLEQKVRMKMDNYPFHEYGQINGKVKEISLIPNEQTYLIEVSLTEGLVSSYNRIFVYTPEMSGTAEIITEDLRLMERIFNKFKKIFD